MRALLLLLLPCWMGCTQMQMLPYLDQIMVLQDLANDKAAQEKLVKKIDTDVDRMLVAMKSGKFAQYKTERDVIKAFGPPIISEQEVVEGKIYTQALYRHAIQQTSLQKAHLFYDKNGNLVRWELLP